LALHKDDVADPRAPIYHTHACCGEQRTLSLAFDDLPAKVRSELIIS